MTRRSAGLAGVVVLAAIAWYAWPTETKAVRTRVTDLVEALNADGGESDLARIGRAAALASALTPDVVVSLDATRHLQGREAVLGMARQALQAQGGARVELRGLQVSLGADGTTAVADATLRVDDESYHEVQLHLVKRDGDWLVARAALVQPLTRPR